MTVARYLRRCANICLLTIRYLFEKSSEDFFFFFFPILSIQPSQPASALASFSALSK